MWRQVDGDPKTGHRLQPFARLSKAGCDNPARHITDEPGLLGERDELIWREMATFRVPPSHQRLDAREATGGTLDLRLVIQGQLLDRNGAAKVTDQAQPLCIVSVEVGGKCCEADAAA